MCNPESKYNILQTLLVHKMSSISSGPDLAVKYQRLSAEFVKLRNQVSVLKAAVLDEQAKAALLQRELDARDSRLCKLESERDSLLFRNEQLTKRVENLQESMEAQQVTFGLAKGKKKHREANLRLIAESSRHAFGGPSSSDPVTVLEEELERKISENSGLHSRLFDAERRFDESTNEYLRRIDDLEQENATLKAMQVPTSTEKKAGVKHPKSSVLACTMEQAAGEEFSGKCLSDCDGVLSREMNVPNENSCREHQLLEPYSRSSDGKPSDSAISLDSGEQIELESEEAAMKAKLLEEYYTERTTTLTKSLQHATGRATYYKQECEELIIRAKCDHEHVERLQGQIEELERKSDSLNDMLETTQSNYETQMRELYDHVASQDAKIMAQADKLMLASQHQNAGDAAENGHAKSEKQRTSTWFSSK